MRSKNLIYLCIMFFVAVTIVFLGGYEYVRAQTWTALPPYNLLWPLWSPALSPQTYDVSNLYTPNISPLPIVSDLQRSAMVPPTPVGGVGMDWFQGMNVGMPMAISPSFTMDFSHSMYDLQPDLPDAMEFNDRYGASFLNEWGQMSWHPYSEPGRFAPGRLISTLFEFTTQMPEQELYPLPTKWRPPSDRKVPVSKRPGDWGSFAASGWTAGGGFAAYGGGWLGYGSALGSSGIGGMKYSGTGYSGPY